MTDLVEADNSASLFEIRIWDEWLSTKEAARFLSTTPNAIRIMVCRGKIEASKLGRRLRFKLSDLRDLLLKKGD